MEHGAMEVPSSESKSALRDGGEVEYDFVALVHRWSTLCLQVQWSSIDERLKSLSKIRPI